MIIIRFILSKICAFSCEFPRLVLGVFVLLGVAGFSTLPLIAVSTNPMAGVGETNPLMTITKENNEIFGEQDSLILVLEFPEPPGQERLAFIKAIAEELEKLSGVRRVRYRFLDTDNQDQVSYLFRQFLLGMNPREVEEIRKIFTPHGVEDAFRRTQNRLFLAEDPYIQQKLLEDPMELARFVAESMRRRLGSVSLGDLYLLISSPDSTIYLLQVTPAFASADFVHGKALVDKLHSIIPERIDSLLQSMPSLRDKSRDLRWFVTGKTEFHYESDRIFDRETLFILLFSFGTVLGLLIVVFRSLWAGLLLMLPIAAGVGPNYGLIWLSYSEVNPVVMGASGVLFGLGTDYGVHLWGSLREEIDRGTEAVTAIRAVYDHTGPAVMLGALVGILAFLCLCMSDQPAMAQFGYVGATGLALTLAATLFLFPALAVLASRRQRDIIPRMRVSFRSLSGLYRRRPGVIVAVSAAVIVTGLFFAARTSYEKDLFKVFLARGMQSMAVSEKISRKFHSNFSQPTHLSFDIEDPQEGLLIQRRLDTILERIMEQGHEISSFDSISYLMVPDSVKRENLRALSEIATAWPGLTEVLERRLQHSDLADGAAATVKNSFADTGRVFRQLETSAGVRDREDDAELERSWYMARIGNKYRFLTQIRYSSAITDPAHLKTADGKIRDAVKQLPVVVTLSGPRQVMEQILSSLVSELVRLGLLVLASVVVFFALLFRHPVGVVLSLIPMAGAFSLTLGIMGGMGKGLPFSIVGVAPLIFGLGMDNGVHLVMGCLQEAGSSVSRTMERVTRPIVFTSLTNVTGFVAMIPSKHYSMEFLGWAMVIGMVVSVALTLTTLPALLLLFEKRRERRTRTASP